MKRYFHLLLFSAAFLLAAGLIQGPLGAADEFDMQGWGPGDPYNKLYDVSRFDKFRGWVIGFKAEPPMPAMSPGTILVVKNRSRFIDVHICPTWFAKPADVGVKKGDRVKIRGCWADVAGKKVFMASKIKKDNFFEFKVRLTKNGKPFWTFSPEEVAREISPGNK